MLKALNLNVPGAGFEPARSCDQGGLSPPCLPIPPPGRHRKGRRVGRRDGRLRPLAVARTSRLTRRPPAPKRPTPRARRAHDRHPALGAGWRPRPPRPCRRALPATGGHARGPRRRLVPQRQRLIDDAEHSDRRRQDVAATGIRGPRGPSSERSSRVPSPPPRTPDSRASPPPEGFGEYGRSGGESDACAHHDRGV